MPSFWLAQPLILMKIVGAFGRQANPTRLESGCTEFHLPKWKGKPNAVNNVLTSGRDKLMNGWRPLTDFAKANIHQLHEWLNTLLQLKSPLLSEPHLPECHSQEFSSLADRCGGDSLNCINLWYWFQQQSTALGLWCLIIGWITPSDQAKITQFHSSSQRRLWSPSPLKEPKWITQSTENRLFSRLYWWCRRSERAPCQVRIHPTLRRVTQIMKPCPEQRNTERH